MGAVVPAAAAHTQSETMNDWPTTAPNAFNAHALVDKLRAVLVTQVNPSLFGDAEYRTQMGVKILMLNM